jgi:glycosyltransferase involved in cell wall biosynthesis
MIDISQEEIMEKWPRNIDIPLVSIQCATYNQQAYIARALDGFLKQKTDFPFEVIVHDDASTDETAKIVREYEKRFPHIIKPIYEIENQYSKHDGSLRRIIDKACKGKYFAICEGDDFWTDPLKLQKQIDYLEKNESCGLVYAKCKYFYESERTLSKKFYGGPNETFDDLIKLNTIPTLTVVYRADLYFRYLKEIVPENKKWGAGDLPTWLWFSCRSKIHFIDECVGVYRYTNNSASHGENVEKQIQFKCRMVDVKSFFLRWQGRSVSDKWMVYSKSVLKLRVYAINRCYKLFLLQWISLLKQDALKTLTKKELYLYTLFFFSRRLSKRHV